MNISKFNAEYFKIIHESATDISSEQIVIDAINDEFIENGIILKDSWKIHVSPIVEYIENQLDDEETLLTIDYLKLINYIKEALNEFSLIEND